jgi:hypothetical protein
MIEQQAGVDYKIFVSYFHKLTPSNNVSVGLNRDILTSPCQLASSESDRKLIKYAACASANVSAKKASSMFGISTYTRLKYDVENALQKACKIRKEVLEIAALEERAFLRTLGVDVSSSSESEVDLEYSSSCEWTDSDEYDIDNEESNKGHSNGERFDTDASNNCDHTEGIAAADTGTHSDFDTVFSNVFTPPSNEYLAVLLRENKLNWFAFVHKLMLLMKHLKSNLVEQVLLDFGRNIASMDFTEEEQKKVEQSRLAYLMQSSPQAVHPDAIVTDSESDDPEEWLDVKQLKSPQGFAMIKKQRNILRCRTKRTVAKELASNCLLKRKLPKRVSAILKEVPNIGTDVEAYVKSKRCGADAWRRTGVITFDGNRRRGPKVSYRQIQQHLREKYNTSKRSYGTIVQLCTVRNKRKLSAKRYMGVAKVTCRRSRKGFNVKYNPDAHWNCSLYKGLDVLQLSDGHNKVLVNRDDQAPFRLDMTHTHTQGSGSAL